MYTYFLGLTLFWKNLHSVDTGLVIEDAGVEVEAEVEVGQEVEITPVFHLIWQEGLQLLLAEQDGGLLLLEVSLS